MSPRDRGAWAAMLDGREGRPWWIAVTGTNHCEFLALCVHYWHDNESHSQEAQESTVWQRVGQLCLSGRADHAQVGEFEAQEGDRRGTPRGDPAWPGDQSKPPATLSF